MKGAWSLEEDENLVTLIAQGFTNWSELATHTPGRTAKQVSSRKRTNRNRSARVCVTG